jgi:hypothetical protein
MESIGYYPSEIHRKFIKATSRHLNSPRPIFAMDFGILARQAQIPGTKAETRPTGTRRNQDSQTRSPTVSGWAVGPRYQPANERIIFPAPDPV